MPYPLDEEDGSADGAIKERLAQRSNPNGVAVVEVGGEGSHVKEHNHLREGERADHRRHESRKFDLMTGQNQFLERHENAEADQQIESDAADAPHFALDHGQYLHTITS